MKSQLNNLVELFTSNDLTNHELGFQLMEGCGISINELAEACFNNLDEFPNNAYSDDDNYEPILMSIYELSTVYTKDKNIKWDHIEVYDYSSSMSNVKEIENIDIASPQAIKEATIECIEFILTECLKSMKDGI